MNVDEYFPEGLSVIHHDESEREGQSSSEGSPKFPIVLHCHICYRNINKTINNADYIKPCNCQLMFVHRVCAERNKKKFGEAKCSSCGHGSTIPRAAKMSSIRKVGTGANCCSESGVACAICKEKTYKKKSGSSNREDIYTIKPCFCSKLFHYGCLRLLINEKPFCSQCNVFYSEFKAATKMQFFATNWKWFVLYITMLSIVSTLFLLALKSSLIFTKNSSKENDINKEIMLTFFSVFFLVVIFATIFSVVKYTWSTALPKFQITQGKVVLNPFKTPSKIKSKPELCSLPEKEFEEIPLSNLRHASAGDVEEGIENARSTGVDDMTLGQHMFGVYATHHSSSTPIDKPPLAFVFNSA
uniref:RING-CH-type domain-containing protein n=1 Tax=Caenorhabditis tropicalis TaxID=1561998 RepID=A0A1I7V0G4_9PELO